MSFPVFFQTLLASRAATSHSVGGEGWIVCEVIHSKARRILFFHKFINHLKHTGLPCAWNVLHKSSLLCLCLAVTQLSPVLKFLLHFHDHINHGTLSWPGFLAGVFGNFGLTAHRFYECWTCTKKNLSTVRWLCQIRQTRCRRPRCRRPNLAAPLKRTPQVKSTRDDYRDSSTNLVLILPYPLFAAREVARFICR